MQPQAVLTIGAGNDMLKNSPEMLMGVQFFEGAITLLGATHRGGTLSRLSGLALATHYLLPIADDAFMNQFRMVFGRDFRDVTRQTVEWCCILEDARSGWTLAWNDNLSPQPVEISLAPGAALPGTDQVRAFLAALTQAFPSQAAQIPPPGTPRTLTKQTTNDEGFLRFTFHVPDPRVDSVTGLVKPGTYCAPFRDGQKISSGFEAVGRFALPVPLPYNHVVLLVPPTRTIVDIGTVVPNFGQAGGGVEALFPHGFTNANLHYHALPAY